jgi:hypothetical protein
MQSNRTPLKLIRYALYIFFSDVSLKPAAEKYYYFWKSVIERAIEIVILNFFHYKDNFLQ